MPWPVISTCEPSSVTAWMQRSVRLVIVSRSLVTIPAAWLDAVETMRSPTA